MKKFIKIIMRDKENSITLPFEVAEEILTSPDQMTMIKKDGIWTGEIINKSEIVATHRDYDEEKDFAWQENKDKALGEGEKKVNETGLNGLKEEMNKIKDKFKA